VSDVVVVDYGIGNLGSVLKAFRHLGVPASLSGDPRALGGASAIVLPGDGAFGASMDELRQRGLLEPLLEAVRAGTPLLGICIGMQLRFEESEEMGRHRGLALLRGRVRRLPPGKPVPHKGWNTLRATRPHGVMDGLGPAPYVYFVHSYFCDAGPADVVATTDYRIELPAIVGRGRVLGLQFHPEKSQALGLRLLGNALRVLGVGGAAELDSAAPPPSPSVARG
jgi:glutamine amidotransferase